MSEVKEKAKELVDKFMNVTVYIDEDGNKETIKDYNRYDVAKQCALICVDEMKELLNNYSADVETVMDKMTDSYFEYLEEVKQEIKELKQCR